MTKIIAHLDMDAFFASVAEVDHPWLKGLPIAIGSDPEGGIGRGVVATANYPARKYGIRSALPIQKAWKFSEEARLRGEKQVNFLVPNSKRYSEMSKEVFDIVQKYTKKMQITSIDEVYFDLSYTKSFKKATEVANKIKKEIKRKTKLTCSIGIAPNKMIAKIASDFQKPNGLTVIKESEVFNFLGPLSIRTIPGVGPKTEIKLRNIKTIGDAREFAWEELYKLLGSYGFDLYQKVRGIGSDEIEEESIRKSIGHHETFYEDTNDMKFVFGILENMSEKILVQMKRKGFKDFRTIVITVRFSDFETHTRSITVDKPDLYMKAIKLALPFFDTSENPKKKQIRMIGLRIENLI